MTHHYRCHPLQESIPGCTAPWSSLWGSWAPQTSEDPGGRCPVGTPPTCPGRPARAGPGCPVCTAGCTRSSGCTGSPRSGSHSACLLGRHLAGYGTRPHLEDRGGELIRPFLHPDHPSVVLVGHLLPTMLVWELFPLHTDLCFHLK